MGGGFALIGGFVGLVGLAAMFTNAYPFFPDPVGVVVFSLLLLNGLFAVFLRVTGRDRSKQRNPYRKGRKPR